MSAIDDTSRASRAGRTRTGRTARAQRFCDTATSARGGRLAVPRVILRHPVYLLCGHAARHVSHLRMTVVVPRTGRETLELIDEILFRHAFEPRCPRLTINPTVARRAGGYV